MTTPQDPCAHCHREATDTLIHDGIEIKLCPSCWCWATLDAHQPDFVPAAVPEDAPEHFHGPCEDCHTRDAVRRFDHLDGRRFQLCESCWNRADHTEDYLMFCMCAVPHHGEDGVHCNHCHFEIREWREDSDEEEEDSESEEEGGGDDCRHCGRIAQYGLCPYCEEARQGSRWD